MEHPVLRRSEKYVHSMFLDPAYLGHAVIQSHSGLEDLEDLEGEVPQQRSFCCDSTYVRIGSQNRMAYCVYCKKK